MEYELLRLSQLDDDGMRRLAALHHSVMRTLLSDLGLPMVLRYYQVARSDPLVIGLCALSSSGEMLGWALGSPHPDRLNSRLRTPLAWFLSQMLRLAFTRPLVLRQLISSVLRSFTHQDMEPGAIELTYIGVASDQRGKGWGKELLNAFIEASRLDGYRLVIISVEMENTSAVALYKKAGFRIIKTSWEGRYQRHRMELVLA
jgi:ribosomal protein S18 acetylase RimI-like enzyme